MVIADAGFFIALFDRADHHHGRAVRALENLDEGLVSTWLAIGEASYYVLSRHGAQANLRFLNGATVADLALFELGATHWPRITRLMRQYADLPMDLADASLVLLAEEIGEERILSTDERDFAVYRWRGRKLFRRLLFEA